MGQRYNQLSLDERCTIARLHADGQSFRKIAASLDRSPSTISRELSRNSGCQVGYRPAYAAEQAWARRWRGGRMARQPDLRKAVLDRLAMGWSPQQISGRLAREHGSMVISHESIYRYIYAQIRRTNDFAWRRYLPQGKSKRGRRRKYNNPIHSIKNRVSIRSRPARVQNRREYGHWEADLLHPRKSGAAILVAQERVSRFTLMAKLPGKHAGPVADTLSRWFSLMPRQLRRTLTNDNGPEFFFHHKLNDRDIKTYFCDPHCPWQKGTVENTNGRIRRYIPLGTDPNTISQRDIEDLASLLNNLPRKVLGYRTPAEVFSKKTVALQM